VNGAAVEADASPDATLQHVLHHGLGLREVRYGCGEGACGACAVLLDGEAVASCLLLALQADGREVVTARGLETEHAARLREHFVAHEAFQCGYCACGMLVSASSHLEQGGSPSAEAIRRSLAGNLCRCTGYAPIVEAVAAAASGAAAPTDERPRVDLREKLDGTAVYPTDRQVANALVGAVLWSEYPSARIVRIDVDEAERLPGVVAVVTARDVPGRNLATTTLFGTDQPLLAGRRVSTMGDAVALVAAETEDATRKALRRIRVSYQPLPAVTDVRRAVEPGSPPVARRGNVVAQFVDSRGDLEGAFRDADLVVEGTYDCESTDHACMELEGGTGWLEGDRLLLAVPCQTPYTVQRGVARLLGIAPARVSVVSSCIGGSFGKYLVPSIEGYLALLVHRTGLPVRLVLRRDEVLARRAKRHALVGRYRLALRRDGSFLALDADLLTDAGPYRSMTPIVVGIFATEATGAYEFPNLLVRVRGVLTNNLPAAPQRGFGSQQANFGVECIVARAAQTLGIDPLELRRMNVKTLKADALAATVEAVARRGMYATPAEPGWLVGRGVASVAGKYGYPGGFVDRTLARVSVDSDGRFRVETDLVDAGTGVTAAAGRLVADALDLRSTPEHVTSDAAFADPTGLLLARGRRASRPAAAVFQGIESSQLWASRVLLLTARLSPTGTVRLFQILARPIDAANAVGNWLKSQLFPYGIDTYVPRTSGSRGTMMTGRAVLDAVERFRHAAVAAAAPRLGVPPSALAVTGSGVEVASDPARALTWGELAEAAGGSLRAVGRATLPSAPLLDRATGNQTGPLDFMPATHYCELAVEPESGAVRILRYLACHDVGRAVNPRAVRGQLLGGIAMGIGQALFERLHLEDGRVGTTGLRDYLVPTSLDLPDEIELELLELESGLGPFGAKGVGEAGAVAAPAAVANALYDALDEQLPGLPATPDEIARLARRRVAQTSATT
jgi:xanthine dehydrogenase molybdenum-binding subunit